MKLGKKMVTVAVVVVLILTLLLNLIIFTVFKPGKLEDKDLKLVFWFSYAFVMVAVAFQIAAIILGKYERGVESVFMGFPLIKISWFYFAIAFVLSTVFMILVSFGVRVPFMLMLVLEILLVGFYLIAFIVSLAHKDAVVEIDKTIKANVFSIRSLVTDVEMLAQMVSDVALRSKLNRLAEDIKYSDPMTNDYVKDLDMQMKDAVAELEVMVSNQDYAAVEDKIKQAQLIVAKRNKRLADSK